MLSSKQCASCLATVPLYGRRHFLRWFIGTSTESTPLCARCVQWFRRRPQTVTLDPNQA